MDELTGQRTLALRKPIRAGALLGILRFGCLALGPICLFSPTGFAASANPLSGEILGQVKNAQGVAQMGATIYLYNRYEQMVARGLSNEQGRFVFEGLVPDVYSLRVLLASFVPAERRNIAIFPSSENRLDINLTSVVGNLQFSSVPSAKAALMSDDWKWVLRSSQATRPILRLLPASKTDSSSSSTAASLSSAFSNASGIVKISSGNGESLSGAAGQDLGTGFALAASVNGTGRVQLSGNVGYSANSPMPSAGFRSTYTRTSLDGSSHPLFVATVRQIFLAPQAGAGESTPALRTVSAAYLDRLDLLDSLSIDYGVALDSVAYLHRASNVSPFVRVTYRAGNWGRVRVGASSGSQPNELVTRDREGTGNLDQDLVALASLPTVSRSEHRLTMQRNQNVEVGWEKTAGTRTYSAAVYDEVVSNAAFLLSATDPSISAADLLPDLSSNSSIFNVGSYHRTGYTTAVRQTLGDRAEVSVAVGRTGALVAGNNETSDPQSSDLRAGIRSTQRNWATVRVTSSIPRANTRISADYGWTDFHVLMPAHLFTIQDSNQDTGANIRVRQPLPISGLPWRMEATVEMRNMLAQGYVPLGAGNSRSVLTSSPRSLRGGLNIIF